MGDGDPAADIVSLTAASYVGRGDTAADLVSPTVPDALAHPLCAARWPSAGLQGPAGTRTYRVEKQAI